MNSTGQDLVKKPNFSKKTMRERKKDTNAWYQELFGTLIFYGEDMTTP